MEINGLANIHIIVDNLQIDLKEDGKNKEFIELEPYVKAIKEQLLHLERYLLACSDISEKNNEALSSHDQVLNDPLWHEVRDNPTKYPTLKERVKL